MTVGEQLANSDDVVPGGGPGQRSFGTLSAGAGSKQRSADPEQKDATVYDGLPETSYTFNFIM